MTSMGNQVVVMGRGIIWELAKWYFLIKFIEITLVDKIIQVSSFPFYNPSPAYCIVCLSPKSNLLSPYNWPPLLCAPPTLTSGNYHTVVSMSFSLFLFFICCLQFYIPHLNEIMWFLTFSVQFIQLNIISSRSIHAVVNSSISSFLKAD